MQTGTPQRRGRLPAALLVALACATTAASSTSSGKESATAAPAPPPAALLTAPQAPTRQEIERAAAAGLAYLKTTQDPVSGGWISDVGYKYAEDYKITRRRVPHVGTTSLALMAFLSGGHLPGRGPYGDVVARGLDFILGAVNPEDGFISHEGTRMYSHAFATLLLAEVYGMTHRTDVKEKLQQAVDLTVASQNDKGSWRYWPYAPDSDMSITVCQVMALRAARNVGIRVPKIVIDRAMKYVDRSAITSRYAGRHYGGFKYQDEVRSRTSFAVTAAGVATINHAGSYDNQLIAAGIGYLRREMPRFNLEFRNHYFYWYGHYYAAQVFFLAQDNPRHADLWERWYWPTMAAEFLTTQNRANGSWVNAPGPGPSFATAVACIILQIRNEYLPIFHR